MASMPPIDAIFLSRVGLRKFDEPETFERIGVFHNFRVSLESLCWEGNSGSNWDSKAVRKGEGLALDRSCRVHFFGQSSFNRRSR
jgi:hypothetical protein